MRLDIAKAFPDSKDAYLVEKHFGSQLNEAACIIITAEICDTTANALVKVAKAKEAAEQK